MRRILNLISKRNEGPCWKNDAKKIERMYRVYVESLMS